MRPRWCRLWLAVTLLLAGSQLAEAQPSPAGPAARPARPQTAPERPATAPTAPAVRPRQPAAPQRPWHKGVSTANKTRALGLYNLGNSFFAKSQWSQALSKYEKAVALWDHPGIRYNMAKCLMELKRYLEAYRSLKLALRFGAAPLDPPRLFKEGQFLRGVLERMLARVRIVCRQPGVRITLDGRPLFVGPGEQTRLLDPSQRHVVVATKSKHITVTRTLAPLPGRLAVVSLRLMGLKKALVMKRRWPRWLPWTVLAAGVVVAGVGIPLVLKAIHEIDDYDSAYDAWCHEPGGCLLSDRPTALADMHDQAMVSRALAVTFLTVGALGIAAGVALAILNLPRAVSPERPPAARPRVTLQPAVGRGGGALTLTLRY